MTDELNARALAVVKALKNLSSAYGQAPDVVASVAAEAASVIDALLAEDADSE